MNLSSFVKQAFVMILCLVFHLSGFSQNKPKTPTGTTSPTVPPPAKGKPAPAANVKNIKAKGIIAADMDCAVKLNGAAKTFNVKAYTPFVVTLNYGDNTVEATSTDKSVASNVFRTVIKVADTARRLVEVSFYDDSKFLDYIKNGKVEMVETALKKYPYLANNEQGTLAMSPLVAAITNSQPEVVKLLMNKGASFKQPDNIFPLHRAALFASSQKPKDKPAAPDRDLVDYFLSKGCKITDVDDGGNTPLHSATRGVKLDLVMYFVELGADVNAKNDFGDTPMKIAQGKGAVSIINFLRTKGAEE
jgi:Ankyrin repeats (many copies)